MPQTVPSSPTKGAVEPTVASSTWPNCSLCSTACRASRSTRVNCWDLSPAVASVPPAGSSVAAINGSTSASRSKAATFSRAWSTEADCQKAAVLRATSPAARRSSQAFHRITTQLATDMASSRIATSWLTMPPWVMRLRKSMRVTPFLKLPQPAPRLLFQAQHVEHVEQAGCMPVQETGGAQAALGIVAAAGRLVADFDALAGAQEHHSVVAHDVAAAHGGKADGQRVALTRHAFAGIDTAVLEVAAQRTGDHFAHLERGAGGRVNLVAMVGLDDFDVVARGQGLGRHL